MSDNGDLELLWCDVGHEWTRPKKKKTGRPMYCDAHNRFMQGAFSNRCKVPDRVKEDWELSQELLEEDGYIQRWKKTWEYQARLVASVHNSWSRVDLRLLEIYVDHLRLSELHRRIAEAEPYYRTDKKSIKPHPGWALADKEASKANACAKELGLVTAPEPSKSRPSADQYKSRLQGSAEEQEEEGGLHAPVGPDGGSL